MRFWFGVIDVLALSDILGTSFIDRLIRGIFPSERKIVPHYSIAVAIQDTSNFDEEQLVMVDDQSSFSVKEASDEEVNVDPCVPIILARQKTLPPMSETPVHVDTIGAVLIRLTSHVRLIIKRVAIVAQEIMQVIPGRPFVIIILNLSRKPMHLPNSMYGALGVDFPSMIITIPKEIT